MKLCTVRGVGRYRATMLPCAVPGDYPAQSLHGAEPGRANAVTLRAFAARAVTGVNETGANETGRQYLEVR
jgi:hypothetical protein